MAQIKENYMIQGIGIDIIDLHRISKLIKRNPRFITKVLASKERVYYHTLVSAKRKVEYVAGRFAAKEALGKALGTGLGKLCFTDIAVLNDDSGKPVLYFPGDHLYHTHVSISHSDTSAVANVVLDSY